ncbi:pentapeptide repeat-containing protein [bacterium]|nr:pentapeptide repeat-containing protein [bacterium]
MGGTCEQKLADSSPCGRPEYHPDGGKCRLHAMGVVAAGDTHALLEYISDHADREVIDLSGLEFREVEFGEDFENAIVSHGHSLFSDNAIFDTCQFKRIGFINRVEFSDCTFDNTSFVNCAFGGDAHFGGSSFHYEAPPFSLCTFGGKGTFFNFSKFRGSSAPFDTCMVGSEALSFANCLVEADQFYIRIAGREVGFYDVRYLAVQASEIDFTGLKFQGHFELANDRRSLEVSPLLHFGQLNFAQMRSATFVLANLEKASFIHAILETVRFINVRWPDHDDRRIAYDELQHSDKSTLEDLRWEYQQLKKNSESNQDYVRAGQWFYRETEIRRQMAGENCGKRRFARLHQWFTCETYALYKAVSEYGENYPRAFLWLAGLWVVFGFWYFFTGFDFADRHVEYHMCWDCTRFSGEHILDFLRALLFSAAAMALQVGRTVKATSTGTVFGVIVQLICTATILPLFLLALRRKFRR